MNDDDKIYHDFAQKVCQLVFAGLEYRIQSEAIQFRLPGWINPDCDRRSNIVGGCSREFVWRLHKDSEAAVQYAAEDMARSFGVFVSRGRFDESKNWRDDSDMIFKQVTTAAFKSFVEARAFVCGLYVPDMSISRGGIANALKRLEHFYSKD